MSTQASPRLVRSRRGSVRRSVPRASTCGQVRRSLQLCRFSAHGELWNVHHVAPNEVINRRSRFARVVPVAAGLERGVERVAAKKHLAASWQHPRRRYGRISPSRRVAGEFLCSFFLAAMRSDFKLIEAYSPSGAPECLNTKHRKIHDRDGRSSRGGPRSRGRSRGVWPAGRPCKASAGRVAP